MCWLTTPTNYDIHRNPLVSSELMRKRMGGRKMIRIPQIHSNIKKEDCDISGDWVTGGVIVNKLPPKETVKVSDIWTHPLVINSY